MSIWASPGLFDFLQGALSCLLYLGYFGLFCKIHLQTETERVRRSAWRGFKPCPLAEFAQGGKNSPPACSKANISKSAVKQNCQG